MRTYNFLMCKVFSSSFLHVIFVGYALDNLSTYVIWSVILMVLCTLSMIGILFFFFVVLSCTKIFVLSFVLCMKILMTYFVAKNGE